MKKLNLAVLFLALLLLGGGLFAQNDFSEEGFDDFDDFNIEVSIPDSKPENSSSPQTEAKTKTSIFEGKLSSYLSLGLNSPQEFLFQYHKVQLEYSQVQKNLVFFVKLNARYNSLFENDLDQDRRLENLRFDLTEAYISYQTFFNSFLSQWDFKIGQQIINWGKADELRPTDILNPQDLTLLLLEDRIDRKLGRFALKTAFSLGESFKIEALWLPLARASVSTRDALSPFTPHSLVQMQNLGFSVSPVKTPNKKLKNSDVALKLYGSLFNTDFSFSFYNGYDPLSFSKITVTNISDITQGGSINLFLNRVTFWGFDFERAIGAVVVRGELAYFTKGMLFGALNPEYPLLTAKYQNQGFLAQKDYLDLTLGVDKVDLFIPGLYLNLQYSLSWVKDYEDGLTSRYGTQLKSTNHMGIWNLAYDWGNLTYRLEIAGNYNFTHKDWMLNPSFQLKIGPETKLILGAYLFFGNNDTLLGQYDKKDFAYLQLEHLF